MSSQELIKNTVVGILKAGNKAEDFLGNTLKAFDLSLQQFNVLRILRGRKGEPANLKTVQKRMIHKMSNTTRLIDKLIDKSLVHREICEENRRKVETKNFTPCFLFSPVAESASAVTTITLSALTAHTARA